MSTLAPTPTSSPDILDDTCKTPPNQKDLSIFKYEEFQNISIYSVKLRFPSYVGYPCSVPLWNVYHEKFQMPLLRCPFANDLDTEFDNFKTNNISIKKNRPLHFQLICFSRQHEICEPLNPPPASGTDCLGVCKCMDPIDITYPDTLSETDHKAEQILENGVRCGVKNGRACIPSWKWEYVDASNQTSRSCDSTPALEAKHLEHKKDLYLQCEQNAGCLEAKKICQCAVGHKCSNSANKLYNDRHDVMLLILLYTPILIFSNIFKC
ncbi:unnamed protein product [Orchesella dallaii]|uniref:Uncharacterized protein n=1 Tax=Orchesella dallaii TaxID=48710 RepID=A0ABP1PR42_9HEXA